MKAKRNMARQVRARAAQSNMAKNANRLAQQNGSPVRTMLDFVSMDTTYGGTDQVNLHIAPAQVPHLIKIMQETEIPEGQMLMLKLPGKIANVVTAPLIFKQVEHKVERGEIDPPLVAVAEPNTEEPHPQAAITVHEAA